MLQAIHLHFFANGNLGVNFFFVLSGFLISWLLLAERDAHQKINVRAFYIRRILRIWPLYFLIVVVAFLFPFVSQQLTPHWEYFTNQMNAAELPWYIFFMGNFDIQFNGVKNIFLTVLWSVSIEEQFYLFWPLLVRSLKREHFKIACLAVILISFLYRCVFPSTISSISTLAIMSELAIGGLAGYYAMYDESFRTFFQNLSRQSIIFIYLLLSVYIPLHGMSHYFGERPYLLYYPFESILFSVFFAFIILEQNFSRYSLVKFGKVAVLTRLGKVSYGLYVYHMLSFPIAFFLANSLNLSIGDFGNYLLKIAWALALTISISLFSYKYFESYFLRFKKKFEWV